MTRLLHKLLYRVLPLRGYLRTVSRLYFLSLRLGLGRRSEAMEYVYMLPKAVRAGDVCIDIGANLGYYARPLSKIAGPRGRVIAVEPVPVMREVLERNLRGCTNTEILPYALGGEKRTVTMCNDSALTAGYLGTGRNRVEENPAAEALTFEAQMRRGSELFARLERLDFIKCDVEGYELHIMRDMRPLLERFHPTVLIETGGENRPQIIELFTQMGYRAETLEKGRLVPLEKENGKDILFLHD
ncbi:MAG: FkbM family methyltransferase [Alistipes sp.]|nr:FkbM family methyltransferase [Alistipes sp.]